MILPDVDLFALAATALVVTIPLILYKKLSISHDSTEPPMGKGALMLFGLPLGCVRKGFSYMVDVSRETKQDIFTVNFFGTKMYLPTTPELISEIQRKPAALDFNLVTMRTVENMLGLKIYDKLMDGYDTKDRSKDTSLVTAIHHRGRPMLAPSESLDEITFLQLQDTAQSLNILEDSVEVCIFDLIQRMLSFANMRAFCGKHNIFDDVPGAYEDFFTYDADLGTLSTGVLPWLISPRSHAARLRLHKALVDWKRGGHQKTASAYMQMRDQMHADYGLTLEENAIDELAIIVGFLSNAMPFSVWMITNLYSRPEVLEVARKEIEQSGIVRADGLKRIISITHLRTASVMLNSLFWEVLRVYASAQTARYVSEDTIIGGKYMLKKGSTIMMKGAIIHEDTCVWGPDALEFNPYRFLASPSGAVGAEADGSYERLVPPAAFRTFGGGKSMCHGRFFVQNEVIGLAVILAMGWDVTGIDGEPITVPEVEKRRLNFGTDKPDKDIKVKFIRRPGTEKWQWGVE